MLFFISGVTKEGALVAMRLAMPVLKKYGVPVDTTTVIALPEAFCLNDKGEVVDTPPVTFYVPAFDKVRLDGNLSALTLELAEVLGCPCHTIEAPVIAGFAV